MSIYQYNFESFDIFYVRKLNPLEERKIINKIKYGVINDGKTFYLNERNDTLAMDLIRKYLEDQIINLNDKLNRVKRKIELCNNFNNIKVLKEHSYNKESYNNYIGREIMKDKSLSIKQKRRLLNEINEKNCK